MFPGQHHTGGLSFSRETEPMNTEQLPDLCTVHSYRSLQDRPQLSLPSWQKWVNAMARLALSSCPWLY